MSNSGGTTLQETTASRQVDVGAYEPFIGKDRVEALKRLAGAMKGKGWTNVECAREGGPVDRMLTGLLPLAAGLGIEARRYTLARGAAFDEVASMLRDLLRGDPRDLRLDDLFTTYLNAFDESAREALITADMISLHDPQLVAMVMNGTLYGNVLWHCHLDSSAADATAWRFLLPYVNQCAGAVFQMPGFAGNGLRVPVYSIMQCMDPLAENNRQLSRQEALEILSPLLDAHGIDPQRPILAVARRFGPHSGHMEAIHALARLREAGVYGGPAPCLVLMGDTAGGDPRSLAALNEVRTLAGDDPDIRFLADVENRGAASVALSRLADVFLDVPGHVAPGMPAVRAMWQGTPVVSVSTSGVGQRMVDGLSGMTAAPRDVDGIVRSVARLLDDEGLRASIGDKGRTLVRDRFLLPEALRAHLELLRHYARVHHAAPASRISDLTYSEVIGAMRPRPAFFPDDE